MRQINAAQMILIALGVPETQVLLGVYSHRSPSHTKKGPGRYHKSGKDKEAKQ